MSGAMLGILLFFTCYSVGISYGNRYKKIYRFWEDLIAFNGAAKVQITTFSAPLEKILAVLPNGDCKKAANSFLGGQAILPVYLSTEEAEYVRAYFLQLQRLDFSAVSEFLTTAASYFQEKEKKAKKLYEENAKLYKKLGFFGGIAAFILVI